MAHGVFDKAYKNYQVSTDIYKISVCFPSFVLLSCCAYDFIVSEEDPVKTAPIQASSSGDGARVGRQLVRAGADGRHVGHEVADAVSHPPDHQTPSQSSDSSTGSASDYEGTW